MKHQQILTLLHHCFQPLIPNRRKVEEMDSETEDILRGTVLLLLRLLYVHASTQSQSMEQELELLRNAPPSPKNCP